MRYWLLKIALIFPPFLVVSACCAQQLSPETQSRTTRAEPSQTPAAIQVATLGETGNVHRSDNLFFSGQFTQEDVADLAEAGIQIVISLRAEKETDWDEKLAVESAGMRFKRIPIGSPEVLTDEVFDELRTLLRNRTDGTLLHCASANRVGGVWLPFRVLDEGVDLKTALEEARSIGLRSPDIERKSLAYIKRVQTLENADKESSVKPGVNKNYLDPNLDVDSYIEKFEIESREVFVARQRILTACEIETGDTVADIGAGTGLFTREFSVAVGESGWVYAVDIAPRFIEHINQEATKHQLTNITGVICAENSVNLPPNSADVIFVCDTYHHFEYPKSTLASIRSALKSDGHLVIVDFERIPGTSREWLLDHVRAGKNVFRAEIEAAGFKLAEEKMIDGFQENYFLKFSK